MPYMKSTDKITVTEIVRKKVDGEKITVLTAYDHFMAGLLDQAGIDIVLVGDSAGNVVHGFDSTIPVTMEIMLMHTAAAARGTKRAMVVADMPFLSFQPSIETAILNAGRFLKEGGAEAVKLEGGLEMAATVRRVIECGIPVMGHIGLCPQSIHRFGGARVQGKKKDSRSYLMDSALALQEAGCFAIVLELVEAETAREITEGLKTCATIGIGAGVHCDGQVLVTNDMLGLRDDEFAPKFLRPYAELKPIIRDAVSRYIQDVKAARFPNDDESYFRKK